MEALLLQRMLDSVEGREPAEPDSNDAPAAAATDTAARVSSAPQRSKPVEGANAAAENAACGRDGGRAASVHDDVFAQAAEGLMAGVSESDGDGEGDSSAEDAGGSDAEDIDGEAQPAPAAKRRRGAATAKRGERSVADSQAGRRDDAQAECVGTRSKRGAKAGSSGVAVVGKRSDRRKAAAAVVASQDETEAAASPADGSKAQQRPTVVRRATRGRGGDRRGGRGAGGRDSSSSASAAPRRVRRLPDA